MTTIANGKVVNNIEFKIDNKSWKNLDLFQKRLKDLKKQMSGLSGSVKMTASLKTFTNQVEASAKRINKARDSLYSAPSGTGHKVSASSTMFADRMRQEQREIDKAHKEALRMDAERQRRRVTASVGSSRVLENAKRKGLSGKNYAELERDVISVTRNYLDGKIAVQQYRHALNGLARDQVSAANSAKSLGSRYKDLRSDLIQATAAFTAYSAAVDVFNTGKELQSLEAGMTIFAKDEAGVRENMEYIRNLSLELGTNFMVAAKEFTKFSIVSKNKMSTDETRALFRAYSEVATVQQMDIQRFERGLNALNQMQSKSQIYSEELFIRFGM